MGEVRSYLSEDGSLSERFLVIFDDGLKVLESGEPISDPGGVFYVQGVYDDSLDKFVDFKYNSVICDVAVLVGGEALFLRKGDNVYLREFVGKTLVSLVELGESVKEDSRLVMIFTGKREVRYGLSEVSGRIFYYVQTSYKPQRYVFVISPYVEVKYVG